jgi:hypothetical protein
MRSYRVALSICFLIAVTACSGGGSTTASGPTYYLDAINGNDSNTGSAVAPWKTLGKVSSSTLSPGTTIYLKRGDTWHEELDLPSSSLSVDAYGSGALPVIDGSIALDAASWVSLGNNIYSQAISLAAGEGLGNVSQNGALLNFVPWNSDYTSTLSTASDGSFSYAYPDTIYIKVATTPSGNQYRASKKQFGIYSENASNINISHVQIQRFSLNGIGLVNCHNCTVTSVVVAQGGGATIAAGPLYAGNGIECDNSCSNILIDDVSVSDIFDSGISPQTFASNQTASAITISNSSVDKAGFAGVEISVLANGGTTGSSISDVNVDGLTITGSGTGWSGQRYGSEGQGIRIIADTGAGTMSGIQLQRDTVSNSAGDGVRLGGDIGTVSINRTRVNANNIGINVADANAATLGLRLTASLIYDNRSYGVSFNVPNSAGFDIIQNTFSDNVAINLAVFSQAGEAKIQNNIFYNSTAMTHLYIASPLTGGTVDNNCYNTSTNMIGYNTIAYDTLADFTTGTGFEVNGVDGTQVNLVDAAGGIFGLQSNSQCRMLGATGTGVVLDYTGRTYNSPPSMGAFEF